MDEEGELRRHAAILLESLVRSDVAHPVGDAWGSAIEQRHAPAFFAQRLNSSKVTLLSLLMSISLNSF